MHLSACFDQFPLSAPSAASHRANDFPSSGIIAQNVMCYPVVVNIFIWRCLVLTTHYERCLKAYPISKKLSMNSDLGCHQVFFEQAKRISSILSPQLSHESFKANTARAFLHMFSIFFAIKPKIDYPFRKVFVGCVWLKKDSICVVRDDCTDTPTFAATGGNPQAQPRNRQVRRFLGDWA